MRKGNGGSSLDTTAPANQQTKPAQQQQQQQQQQQPKLKPRLGAPPDGGWGWVVTFSSFLISLLVDGVCYSFGIFFDDFREEFKSSKSMTSWIGSVLNGSYLIIGPIVGALVNIYGCRRVAICGSILTTIAFFGSSFSNSLGVLIFSFGFLGGVGFGLMYLPAIVIVGYYFERRRALATGIACCGSGMGAFLFAPFTEYLLDEYGWRGAIWVIAGLVLNGSTAALFYRPLPGVTIEEVTTNDDPSMSQSDTALLSQEEEIVSERPVTLGKVPDRKTSMNHLQLDAKLQTLYSNEDKTTNLSPAADIYRCRSVTIAGPCKISDNDSFIRSDVVRMAKSQDMVFLPMDTTRKAAVEPRRLELPALQRKDIFYSGSLWHVKEFQQLGSLENFRQEMISPTPTTTDRSDMSGDGLTVTLTVTRPTMREALANIFDVALLKSPTFLVYGMSCVLCMAGFFVPFIYLPVHCIDLGANAQNAAFLISIIGITNTVGRVAVGFISDQPWANCLFINNVALMVGGVTTVFVPVFQHYYLLAIYAAVFGTSVAIFVSLRSIIMVELMGIEKLTTAFGFVIMFQGVSSFLGPPAAGALSDLTGNYNASFCMAGVALFLSGVICIPLRYISRWEKNRALAASQNSNRNNKTTEMRSQSNVDDSNSRLLDENENSRDTSLPVKPPSDHKDTFTEL